MAYEEEKRENFEKKLHVRDFNKDEILAIVQEALNQGKVEVPFSRGIDLDNPPKDLVEFDGSVSDIDDAIEKGVIPGDGTYEELTDAQIEGLTKILKKAVKDGIVSYAGDVYMFLNYAISDDELLATCFACINNAEYGYHLEVNLYSSNKQLIVSNSEL